VSLTFDNKISIAFLKFVSLFFLSMLPSISIIKLSRNYSNFLNIMAFAICMSVSSNAEFNTVLKWL